MTVSLICFVEKVRTCESNVQHGCLQLSVVVSFRENYKLYKGSDFRKVKEMKNKEKERTKELKRMI